MKLLSSLKRTSLVKKANVNLAFNKKIFLNSIKAHIYPLQNKFLYTSLENTQNEIEKQNQFLFECPKTTEKQNFGSNSTINNNNNNNINRKSIFIQNTQSQMTVVNNKNFSTNLINKNNNFKKTFLIFKFNTKNQTENTQQNLAKNSLLSNAPKRHFCDTISFGDDLNKLINKIARADMDKIPQKNIRNFCIIAHIDHGKSTLSDRLLEKSGAINKLEKKNSQILDTLKVERERGITVKAQTATMIFKFESKHESESESKETFEGEYILNLIDTPGHVDFAYEVARSLRPCQGAILLVDASKGVQAQTLSNYAQAKSLGLTILPVINKIDLPSAHVESTLVQMEKSMGFASDDVLLISAKNEINLDKVFERIVKGIPSPSGDKEKPLRYLFSLFLFYFLLI